MTRRELEQMKIADLRKLSISEGFGLRYLWELKKEALVQQLAQAFEDRQRRCAGKEPA